LIDALTEFVDRYRGHLRGRPVPPLREDSPLQALVADAQGWRPDGWARTAHFLDKALQRYAEEGVFSPKDGSRSLVADTMRAIWGVSAHPVGAEAVIRRLGLGVGERAVQTWQTRVLADPAMAAHVSSVAARLGTAPPRPRNVRTAWTEQAEAWPPALWDGVDERDLLLSAARTVDALHDLTDEEILVALRQVTGLRLRKWFYEPDRTGHAVYVENMVLDPWFGRDPLTLLAPVVEPARTASGAKYQPAVAAAAQMLMWSALADPAALRAAADDRSAAIRNLGVFISCRVETGSVISAVAAGLDREEGRRRMAALFNAGGAPGSYIGDPRRTADPRAALEAAYRVRSAADPGAKVVLIEDYLRLRPAAMDRARGSEDHGLLALADQSVHWDCVLAEDVALVDRFARMLARAPAGSRWGYGSHAHRGRAVVANKNDRWGEALGHVGAGLAELALLVGQEYVVDAVERESAAHQIWLAGAGIAVRHLERALVHAPRREFSDHVTELARRALWFAGAAWDALAFLDRGGELPLVRHERGGIASVAWRAQTRLIRLRVLLAVRTAIAAKLVPDHLRRVGHDRPLVALGPAEPRPADVGASEVPVLVDLYRELLVLPELTAAHTLDLVLLGSWLAMLNGGNLPVTQDPSIAAVLPASRLLGGDPDAIVGGTHSVLLDVATLTTWLAERRSDARMINHLRRGGPVWRALDRTSGGLYSTFRALHDDVPYTVVSHD
jgi:hypothetical protein